jgi:hypothetical protein
VFSLDIRKSKFKKEQLIKVKNHLIPISHLIFAFEIYQDFFIKKKLIVPLKDVIEVID